jgi:transposase
MFPSCLLPSATDLHLDALHLEESARTLTLLVRATQTSAACPLCQAAATRVHSSYTRHLADLPWADIAIRLQLRVRRFFCPTPHCRRKLFTERLPSVTVPWARRTNRLTTTQQRIGLALGGAAGARLASDLVMPAGIDLLLTLVRRIVVPAPTPPRVVGIDDWAIRKGHTYGSLVVDLEQHRPIDLLPDRSAETVAHWLREHPGIEIISRDRASCYADGASQGAPEATQVADRWHILKNLGEAVLRVLEQHQRAIEQHLQAEQSQAHPVSAPPDTEPSEIPSQSPTPETIPQPEWPTTKQAQRQQERQQRRQARYDEVRTLQERGWSLRAIAAHTGLERKTVRKYLQAQTCPEPQPRPKRRSLLDRFTPYLLERWNGGCHNSAQLLRDIQAQGFRGKRSIVRDFCTQLRKAQGLPPRARSTAGGKASAPTRPPTMRTLTWLILSQPNDLEVEERTQVEQLVQVDATVATTIKLAQEFARMLRDRRADTLDDWLEQVADSTIAALQSFAAGVRRDEAAVRAGLSLTWSNGQTEGHINRLKMLKRQMYGRAKLDLLRQRVLAA